MTSLTRRCLRLLGESHFWTYTGKLHAWLYQRTGGRIGHKFGKLTHLLLTTTGRKSGKPRTVALSYVSAGEDYLLVASNGGSDRHPAWWLNLQKTPHAQIWVGTERLDVIAHNATATERARLWAKLTAINPFYARYEQLTQREIPVVILTRRDT